MVQEGKVSRALTWVWMGVLVMSLGLAIFVALSVLEKNQNSRPYSGRFVPVRAEVLDGWPQVIVLDTATGEVLSLTVREED